MDFVVSIPCTTLQLLFAYILLFPKSSGGAICPLFPRASNLGGTQAEGQVALLPLFPELPNSGAAQAQAQGGNAQAQVSFTQMLTVICSYKVSLQI
jgi:hypothetical protein